MMALTEQVLVLGSSKNTANRERPAGPKHSRLQPYEVFCGTKIHETLAQKIPPCLQYSGTLPKVG